MTGFWVWILLGIQITAILTVIPVGYLIYRNSIENAERERDAGPLNVTVDGRRMAHQLLRAKTDDDLTEDEQTRLRLLAHTLRGRRPLALLCVIGPVSQLWVVLALAEWWMTAFGVVLVLFYLVMAVGIERNARIGNAFLRRHPAEPQRLARPQAVLPEEPSLGPPAIDGSERR